MVNLLKFDENRYGLLIVFFFNYLDFFLSAQLESTLNKITKYNKLSSQKVRLIEENQNLKDSIQISRQSSGGNHLFINRK